MEEGITTVIDGTKLPKRVLLGSAQKGENGIFLFFFFSFFPFVNKPSSFKTNFEGNNNSRQSGSWIKSF